MWDECDNVGLTGSLLPAQFSDAYAHFNVINIKDVGGVLSE